MNPTLIIEKSQSEAEIERLSERVAQLEDENMLLEEALRRNTRMFEALLSNSHDGLTLTGPDRRIVKVIKGLTGVDPNLLIGRLVDAAAVPEDRQTIVDAYRQLLSGRCGKVKIEFRLLRADGAIVRSSATLTDMLDDPNVQGIVWNYSAAYEVPESGPPVETISSATEATSSGRRHPRESNLPGRA